MCLLISKVSVFCFKVDRSSDNFPLEKGTNLPAKGNRKFITISIEHTATYMYPRRVSSDARDRLMQGPYSVKNPTFKSIALFESCKMTVNVASNSNR